MSMWMVSEGWCVSISLPSSTMEIKWPTAGIGYRTIASMAVWVLCVCTRVWQCVSIQLKWKIADLWGLSYRVGEKYIL